MHTRAPVSRIPRLLPALFAAWTLAGCSDGQPLADPQPLAGPLAHRVLQAFDCAATRDGAVSCRPASGAGGPASRVIISGQNVNVQLASSNASYDSATGIHQFDVTVKNLMNEAIGTPDGTVADPDGIQVFFHSGPYVTSGTGDVSVDNPDGTAFFTGSNQPYFAYSDILSKNEVSAPRTWRFSLSPTVQSYGFQVYLETDVQYLLVINELLANPGGTITDATGEWFEVYNAGSRSVNLQNLLIADSATSGHRPYHLVTASITVPAGGYVVLGNTTDTLANGGVTVDYAYGSALLLANSLDAVKISRVYGGDTLTVDRAAYASATVSAQNGISRELINPSLDNANIDGSNWASASTGSVYGAGGRGTPGAQNSAYVP